MTDLRSTLSFTSEQPFVRDFIAEPVVFHELSKRQILVQVGQTVSLDCEATLNVPAKFQWFYGNISMIDEIPLAGRVDRELTFTVARNFPPAHFRCRVVTDAGRVHFSRWFSVRLASVSRRSLVVPRGNLVNKPRQRLK